MSKEKIGLLVMAYGTPYKEEDIERYYTHIRRGKRPSQAEIDDLTARYQAIGGISPLAKITVDQANALAATLNDIQEDLEFKVYIGLRHIEPFIEDAVEQMAKDGIKNAVSIVLAPHYSSFSIRGYNGRAQEEAEKQNIKLTSVESWYNAKGFIDYWAKAIEAVYEKMPAKDRDNSVIVYSAHSLPEKMLVNDPYESQLKETAKLITEKTGLTEYEIGWQSEGNTPDPWIGPDVQDLTKELYEKKQYKAFVFAPVGFVSDHLEVLYDNDYECKVVCDEIGANYYRPDMPNTNERFINALANVVLKQYKKEAVKIKS